MNTTQTFTEQYKLYVELMDRVSERRLKVNQFYLSLISALLIGVLVFHDKSDISFKIIFTFASLLITVICLVWISNIKSYKQLNTGKFKVIMEMEKKLPYPCFSREWEFLDNGENRKVYWELSDIERFLPWLIIAFCTIYTLFLFILPL